MKGSIDSVDNRIIAELSKNARISHASLAGKVHLSRNAVRQRIERLERDGIIQGYTIRHGRADGLNAISALIFVYRHDRMRGANVINALKSIPEVVTCDIVSGQFDLVLRVETDDADRVRLLWDQISSLDGVADTVTAVVLGSPVKRRDLG